MKVHQTLVWLNLLSFGTKDLATTRIGIRSAAVDEARAKSGLSAKNIERQCRTGTYRQWKVQALLLEGRQISPCCSFIITLFLKIFLIF